MLLIFCLNLRKDQLYGKPGKYFLARGPVRLGVPSAAMQVKTALGRGYWGGTTSYGVWGNAVSYPSGIRDGAPAAKRFYCILEVPDGISWNLLGAKFAGRPHHPPPLIRP